MALCTCRYCLCLFKLIVLINTIMLGLLISTYVFFGSMPPSFTMSIAFWLLLYTNFFGIYVLLLTEATFYRNMDIWWINRLTQGGIIFCSFCFALGGILFLIPLTAESMMSFCRTYISIYDDIPPFLDNMQIQFKCCGIYSYLDYGKKGFRAKDTKDGGYGSVGGLQGGGGYKVYRQANPNDDFFYELTQDLSKDRTVVRETTGLDIPRSCCKTEKVDALDEDCGKMVEYTGANNSSPLLYYKQNLAAIQRVNDPQMGCYKKYNNIVATGYQFQLTYLLGVIRLTSLLQSISFMVALWFHRMALKTIRQLHFWLPELENLHDTSELLHEHAELEAEADEAHSVAENKVKKKKDKEKRSKDLEKNKKEVVVSRQSLGSFNAPLKRTTSRISTKKK